MNRYISLPAIVLVIISAVAHLSKAQVGAHSFPDRIAVSARPAKDSITLRWAPLSFSVWRQGNEAGYRVERYVVTRNGSLLSNPERTILAMSLRPLDEEGWEKLLSRDRYAAIAAQALFGDRFEVDLRENDVFSIVNKVQENEQRFAFALFSADMSPQVAKASALWFVDTLVVTGEKYLYRIAVNGADSLRGSIFISPDDPYQLVPPRNLKAEFKDRFVSLRWDQATLTPYTAYHVERSSDGLDYRRISATPIVTVSPDPEQDTRYEYATDSIPNASERYYYRVKGVTPFGEDSPPSDPVDGRSIPAVESLPFIKSAETRNNTTVMIEWEFGSESEHAIEGFSVERASEPRGDFESLTPRLLSPGTRIYEDLNPNQTNYYRVRARGLDQEWYPSHVYLAQLVDSIPPAQPSGLEAKVDQKGNVLLSWSAGSDTDIYGYRVYRANVKNEEPAQITIAPVASTSFNDSINLETLNENIYYTIMAIDINQNHSALSEPLEVPLPDIVKPQPPVFLPVVCSAQAIRLSWIPGASTDILFYKIFRKSVPDNGWKLLKTFPASGDTVYTYLDETPVPGKVSHYTVISVDDAGLESEPAQPVSGLIARRHVQKPVTWKKPFLDRAENELTIGWKYEAQGIESYKIFRSTDDHHPIHYKTITGNAEKYVDKLIPGKVYKYRIMAVFTDGRESYLSDELKFEY